MKIVMKRKENKRRKWNEEKYNEENLHLLMNEK